MCAIRDMNRMQVGVRGTDSLHSACILTSRIPVSLKSTTSGDLFMRERRNECMLLESQDLIDVCGCMLHRGAKSTLAWLCFHLPNAVLQYGVHCSKSVSIDHRDVYEDRRRTLPRHATSEDSIIKDTSVFDASVTCSGRRPEPYEYEQKLVQTRE